MRGADLTMYIVLRAEANYTPIQMRGALSRFDGSTADGSSCTPSWGRLRRTTCTHVHTCAVYCTSVASAQCATQLCSQLYRHDGIDLIVIDTYKHQYISIHFTLLLFIVHEGYWSCHSRGQGFSQQSSQHSSLPINTKLVSFNSYWTTLHNRVHACFDRWCCSPLYVESKFFWDNLYLSNSHQTLLQVYI